MSHKNVPRVAAFDVYDTLARWRHTVEEMAAEIGKTSTMIFKGSVDLAIAADLGQISYEEYGLRMAERWDLPGYSERVIAGLTPIQEVHDLAHDFHKAGSRLLIASNVGQGALRMSFERGALPPVDRFTRVVQSCRLGVAKPDPEFFRHIVELTGVTPEDHLFHDDSQENVAAAQAAGMRAVHIDPDDVVASVVAIREEYLPHTLVA